jgi:rhodanese-related sulfurtransferase
MTVTTISPPEAFAMLSQGASLVDIRESDEWRREHIPLARHHALSGIARHPPQAAGEVIFHCRTGHRTMANAERLAATAPGAKVYVLEGGIEAWRDAGLPTLKDRGQPIEIMRQVQIGAGSLVLTGVVLGALVHPGFYALSGFVGAGLVFVGVTGFCGMARLLALAPWNRRTPQPVSA